MGKMIEVTFEVDSDLLEQATQCLACVRSTPEAYIRLCIERTVEKREQLLAKFQQGTRAEELICEIADEVLAELKRRAELES